MELILIQVDHVLVWGTPGTKAAISKRAGNDDPWLDDTPGEIPDEGQEEQDPNDVANEAWQDEQDSRNDEKCRMNQFPSGIDPSLRFTLKSAKDARTLKP